MAAAKKRPSADPLAGLTVKQRRFVEAYSGDAMAAARAAGFASRASASRLLGKPEIKAAIMARDKELVGTEIATRRERQAFWSEVMRDQGENMANRLKASENLGKSEGDFLQRHEIGGEGGGPVRLVIEWASSES